MDELRRQILHEIMKIYGPNQGQSIGAVIVPAFMGNFKKVLDDTESADEVSEEYMTEDKRIHLILKGRKTFGRRATSTMWQTATLTDAALPASMLSFDLQFIICLAW